MAGLIDPTVTGNYPVILGDSLLGKTSNEIFTGVRYNHKPALSSADAPGHARLKPSIPGKSASYDLSYTDDGGSYAYAGARTTEDNEYVMYFDPERKAFILDKVDSTFNMNLTRLPNNSDPDRLAQQFPHLEINPDSKRDAAAGAGIKEKPKPAAKARAKSPVRKEPKRKPEKKQQSKKMELSFPEPAKEKEVPKAKPKAPVDEDEEDDSDDGGLLVEYPGAENTSKRTDFSPAFPPPRRFDEFMDQRESDGGDADAESDDEPDIDFKLPSPVNHHIPQPEPMAVHEDAASVESEDDLEKDLEMAFEDLDNSQEGSPAGDESDISEED